MKRQETGRSLAAILEEARALHAGSAWAEAYEAFAAADAAEPLALADLELLATAAALSGRVDEQLRALERLYDAHLARGEEGPAARAAFWLGMRLSSLGEPARASGWLSRAQRLVEGRDCAERGYLLLSSVRRHETSGDPAGALAAAAEAQAIGDRFRDADLCAFARSVHGGALIRQGRVDEGLSLLDEAMVAATSGKLSPIVTGLAYCTAIACCKQVYALGRGREWTAALSSWCGGQPQLTTFTGKCLVHRSELMQLGGAWGEAIGEARKISEGAKRADPEAAADAFYQQAEIHRLRGEMAEAERAYRAASEHGRDPHPGLALLWLQAGRVEAAAGALRRVLAATQPPLRRAQYLPAAVEVMLAIGATGEAEAAARELDEIAARFGTEVLVAMAAQARGAVALANGRAQEALEPLRQAFAAWQQLGAPFLGAQVRVLIARACEALGDQETARWERELAGEVMARLGAARDAAAPADLAAPDRALPGGLTARELQVLRLVATGKTNKVIAKELFLSEKTVDRHVSNIFTKIDVTSRAAATAFAYEHRLV